MALRSAKLPVVESGLSIAGVGLVLLLFSLFQSGMWADESMEGVEPNTFEWARKQGRQVPARLFRRYGISVGVALIAIGLLVAGAALIAS